MGYTRKYGKKEDWVSVKLEGSKVLEIRLHVGRVWYSIESVLYVVYFLI